MGHISNWMDVRGCVSLCVFTGSKAEKEWVVVKTEKGMFVYSFKYDNSIKHMHKH